MNMTWRQLCMAVEKAWHCSQEKKKPLDDKFLKSVMQRLQKARAPLLSPMH